MRAFLKDVRSGCADVGFSGISQIAGRHDESTSRSAVGGSCLTSESTRAPVPIQPTRVSPEHIFRWPKPASVRYTAILCGSVRRIAELDRCALVLVLPTRPLNSRIQPGHLNQQRLQPLVIDLFFQLGLHQPQVGDLGGRSRRGECDGSCPAANTHESAAVADLCPIPHQRA
jgi:hypothetical protein